jgi:GNAT superfamily N-acetyltransferase
MNATIPLSGPGAPSHLDVHRALFRPATAEELAAFVAPAAEDGIQINPGAAAWYVLEMRDGVLAGVCAMAPSPASQRVARLGPAWVAPEWRRIGAWDRMVVELLGAARASGYKVAETYAVHPGHLLRNGWVLASLAHQDGAVHLAVFLGPNGPPESKLPECFRLSAMVRWVGVR